MNTLDTDVGPHLFEQSRGNEYLATAIALGQGIRQIQPNLTTWLLICERKIGREEKRSFLQPQTCRDEKVGKQCIADAVAIPSAGTRSAIRQEPSQANIPKNPIVVERDEADIRSAS